MTEAAGSTGARRCPVCDAEVPAGADRCPACGRVLGAADRCPHCHAVAGVERSSDGSLRCAACGRERERVAGLTVRGERADLGPGGIRRPRGVAVRATAALLRAAGVGLGVLGLLTTALVGVFLEEGHGLLWAIGAAVSLLLLGAGWGLGTLVDRWSLAKEAERRRRILEQAAALEGGRLTAERAAELLGVPVEEADALLTSWVDGRRLDVDLDEEAALVRYRFLEVERSAGPPRVRVAEGPPEAAEGDEAEMEAALEEGAAAARREPD